MSNIAGMQYLEAIGQLLDIDRASTKEHISYGYQKLLERKSTNKHFTLWGTSGVWMNANIIRVLTKMKRVIEIDDKVIKDAMEYVRNLAKNGSFQEISGGYGVYQRETNAKAGLELSAFVAISFLEVDSKEREKEDTTLIKNILDSVMNDLSSISDNYVKAMYAYAFALDGNKAAAEIWLNDLMNSKKAKEDVFYWPHPTPAVMVETAAYAVMAFVTLEKHMQASQIVNWMLSVRQETGGFYTTTDTVVGIQALAMYAAKVYSLSTNIKIDLNYENNSELQFIINDDNRLTLQVQDLKAFAKIVNYNAEGTALEGNGIAYLQFTRSFFTVVETRKAQFDVRAVPQQQGNTLNLKVCANFIAKGNVTSSGMTLIDVQLPSGYEHDRDNTGTLIQGHVKVGEGFICY